MRRLLFILAAVLTLASALPANANINEDLAKQAAKSWLEATDAGKYGQSWDTAAKMFKSSITKKAWETKLKATLEPLGKVESRELRGAAYTKQLHKI
jgi:hypothetical protein